MEVPLSMVQPSPESSGSKFKSMGDYNVLKEIGEGSFSIVYHAKEKAGEKRDVAIKMCLKKQILREKRVEYVHREKEALAILSTKENIHPAIVILYATFQDVDSLYFVLSYAQYGDLLQIILKQPQQRLTLEHSVYYSAVLFSALNHIHSLGILHRDVKPENLLVKHDGRLMLSDFGSMVFLEKHEKEYEEKKQETGPKKRRNSFVGTAQYVSPEMLSGSKLSISTDFWSFGVVIFQFLTGEHAFHDESEYLVFKRVADALFKFPENFNENAKDLVEKLLIVKPEDRLKSEQIASHPFFENIDLSNLDIIDPPQIFN